MDFSDKNLLIIYLVAFLGILGVAAYFIVKQIFKTTRVEKTMTKLEKKLKSERGTIPEYYELGSIYLDKKMFAQAVMLMQKAIKIESGAVPEMAPVYNALGYGYFGQQQYDLAIKQYKKAIELEPQYTVAINNLGHAYEQKKLVNQALEAYDRTLEIEPQNETAKRRSETLRRRLVTN